MSGAQVGSILAGRNWIGQRSQQVRLENVVETIFAQDLDTSAQAGRSNNTKLGSLRQEYNTSLAGWVELNGGESLSYPVHLPAHSLGFCRCEPTPLVVEDASVLVTAVLKGPMNKGVREIQEIMKWMLRNRRRWEYTCQKFPHQSLTGMISGAFDYEIQQVVSAPSNRQKPFSPLDGLTST
jgi:hypothetical protein